jgi:hypothetical protein
MPVHDLLDRCRHGLRLPLLPLGVLLGVAAMGVALMLERTTTASGGLWAGALVAALGAAGATGVSERAAEGGVWPAIGTMIMVCLGFGLGLCLLALALPGAVLPAGLFSFADAMPIGITPERHDLAEGPRIYGSFLTAGGLVALAAGLLGNGGTLLVTLLHVVAWSVLLAHTGRAAGGLPGGVEPLLRAIGASAPFLLLTLVGMLSLGGGVREGVRRFMGQRQDTKALTTPGVAALVGLLLLLGAASVELFGGGLLSELLGG